MVDRDRVSAFNYGSGTAWYAQSLEPGSGDCLVCPLDLWHLRGTQWHYQFGSLVCLLRHRFVFPGISRHHHRLQYCPFHFPFAQAAT